MDNLSDQISTEIDRRKIKKLIDDGVITEEELAHAPVYELTQNCKCEDGEPNEQNKCTKCGTQFGSDRVA